jgi:hypothetical protein
VDIIPAPMLWVLAVAVALFAVAAVALWRSA